MAESLERVTLLAGVPLAADHLDRHAATPQAGGAVAVVGARAQAAVAASALDCQVGRQPLPRRTRRRGCGGALQQLEVAGEKTRSLGAILFNSHRSQRPGKDQPGQHGLGR